MKIYKLYILILIVFYEGGLIFAQNLFIDPARSYTLGCITVNSGGSSFHPSYFGGISVSNRINEEFHPWSPGVEFVLIGSDSGRGSYEFEWVMFKRNVFYFHFIIDYVLSENQLIVKVEDIGQLDNGSFQEEYAEAFAVYLDRSEGKSPAYFVEVPYLTMFNILLMDNVYTSIYFDWEKTNASQLIPYNYRYSNSSIYFSQYALYNKLTNGKRNKLNETIVLKVSKSIDDVFPVLNNPISKYYRESSERIIFDDWSSFNTSLEKLSTLEKSGIMNLWHIVHDWQRSGYDVSLPEVYPPNPKYGGKSELIKISEYNKKNMNLFSLHENYINIFKSSSYFTTENLAFKSNGNFIFDWFTPTHSDSGFLIKPQKVAEIVSPISQEIHQRLQTNSTFHDVSSSYDPSKYVDYDNKSIDAGKFIQPYRAFRTLADSLRAIHDGPVSGEGLAHFLYVGYYDDITAQIHTARSLPGAYYNNTEKLGGYYKPLFVNFDLLKMKEKAMVHGVGYYERFFYNNEYWKYMGKGYDSALSYAATELAYGHGAFFSTHSYNFIEQGKIEYNYVYSMQSRYWNSAVTSIFYNDNNKLISASDYIRKYPYTFDDFFHEHFMAQVYVKYNNGVIVCVNRHPTKEWIVNLDKGNGYYNYNASKNDKNELFEGITTGGKFVLPPSNGWLCYSQE